MAKTHRASGRAVIIKDGHILLNKFNNGQYYNFPGGGVEEGETLAECAKREVLEESGITVVVNDMLFTLEVETKRCDISGDPHISVFFRCTLDDSILSTLPSKPDFSPDNILEYVRTGVFSPTFLSGHFEKSSI